jgi:hypothetical protein
VWIPRPDLVGRDPVADELGVDAALADAPGDQLCVLAAEVEDEDRALLRRTLREGQNLSPSGNSAPPS